MLSTDSEAALIDSKKAFMEETGAAAGTVTGHKGAIQAERDRLQRLTGRNVAANIAEQKLSRAYATSAAEGKSTAYGKAAGIATGTATAVGLLDQDARNTGGLSPDQAAANRASLESASNSVAANNALIDATAANESGDRYERDRDARELKEANEKLQANPATAGTTATLSQVIQQRNANRRALAGTNEEIKRSKADNVVKSSAEAIDEEEERIMKEHDAKNLNTGFTPQARRDQAHAFMIQNVGANAGSGAKGDLRKTFEQAIGENEGEERGIENERVNLQAQRLMDAAEQAGTKLDKDTAILQARKHIERDDANKAAGRPRTKTS
jgi:hypothetical protein